MNDSKFYLKKLNKQELGYRQGVPGKAGRYIYISKKATPFFPFLSQTQHNDSTLLPLISYDKKEKIYCRYVYHNDKYCVEGGSRDEYRIYLNTGIDPNSSYFIKDDIVIFEKIIKEDTEYILWKFSPTDPQYKDLELLISANKIDHAGNHALSSNLPFLASDIDLDDIQVDFPLDTIEVVKKKQQIELDEDDSSINDSKGASLFTSVSFREFVLYAYDQKCAITNNVIKYEGLNNLEAAHIKPKSHNGSFLPCNGLALSRDMHWAFDKGMITISDTYKVHVHEKVRNAYLGQYHDQQIHIPNDPFFQPNIEFLKYHRSNIFGLFLKSGRIHAVE